MSGVAARETCVLRYVLDDLAATQPDAPLVVFADGTALTCAEARDLAASAAAGFRALGVRKGDRVTSFLPNGRDAIRVWWGLNYLGAVYVPCNPYARGRQLEHVVRDAGATLLVTAGVLVDRLADVDLAETKVVLVHGDPTTSAAALPVDVVSAEILWTSEPDTTPPDEPIEPWDTQTVIYTSGTTGPAKGVLCSYFHAYSAFGPDAYPMLGADDRFMINLPLFHMGGLGLFNGMICRRGSVAFVDAFDTNSFWDVLRATGTTATFLLGVMASFVWSRPPSAADRDHPVRTMFMVPLVDDVPAFAERFGVDVHSCFNMTEISTPVMTERNCPVPGSCGRMRPGVDVRIVDAHDCEVPHGEVGEILVRTDAPWAMNHGYLNNPVATAAAWRNGWFHTGDAGRRDADGNFFFVDRFKDAIRRRGEFISSLELEIELAAHPSVAVAAVVGVPSELAEEEVLAYVIPAEGATVDPVDLVAFLQPRVAHFMIPRYVQVVGELPTTPTGKVRKVELRDVDLAEVWDRVAAGIVIKRDKFA